MIKPALSVVLIIAAVCTRQSATQNGDLPTSTSSRANAPNPPGPRHKESDAFFVQWLESHGHSDVVVDDNGVGVANNTTRLQASLYGSKQHDKGGFIVEMEFTIRVPSNRSITEFVAGIGETEAQAINDAQVNFMLTTFHVVYKGFINDADPHMKSTNMQINGANREVITGDILTRGTASDKKFDFNSMREEIQGTLRNLPLTPEPHWLKVVYSQNNGKPATVAVTLDNVDHPGLTEAVTRLRWPSSDSFYLAKQFIVIR
jgi:hypothetical protein